MVYRQLETEDIPSAKRLWKQAFSDTDNYIDCNFKNNLNLKNSVAIFENDDLVCMLFMIPKTIFVEGKDINTQFIAGVCTDNDYRYKGYAKKLMEYTHTMLKDKGYPFVLLYPFNHDFYRKLGYNTINHMNKTKFDGTVNRYDGYVLDTFDSLSEDLENRVLDIYNAGCKQHDSYFARYKYDFKKILDTLFVDNGKVSVIKSDKKDVGYVFYYLAKEKIECSESIFLDEKAVKAFSNLINRSGFLYCNPKFELDNSELEEYAMINIFDENYNFILNSEVLILEQY